MPACFPLRACALLVLSIAPLPVAAADPASPEAVVEAERAFAAETFRNGFKQGFLAFVAEDGLIFQPTPVRAKPLLECLPAAPPPGPPLEWWPTWAGIANSSDFGFTTGPASIAVRYFTVWQKQSDGSWKWIYDGGPALKVPMKAEPGGPVAFLRPATASAGSPGKALTEVAPLEADLAARAAADYKAAHLRYLAEDGLTAGSGEPSAVGRAAQLAELDRRPGKAEMKPLGGTASGAGDMAFTYGQVRWATGDKPRWGHYARIWQKRMEGWKLVADMVIEAPSVPPPARAEATAR
jgi:ketosteroid isomerase-like protein